MREALPQVVVDSVLGIQELGFHGSLKQKAQNFVSKMAFCSAVTLCFASIFSLVSAALLAIAFSTDNWQTIIVQREALKVRIFQMRFLWAKGGALFVI